MDKYDRFVNKFFEVFRRHPHWEQLTKFDPHKIVDYNDVLLIAPNGRYFWNTKGQTKGAINHTIQSYVSQKEFSNEEIKEFYEKMLVDRLIYLERMNR